MEEAGVDGGGIFKEFLEAVRACAGRTVAVAALGQLLWMAGQRCGSVPWSSLRPNINIFLFYRVVQVLQQGFDPNVGLFQATTDNRLYPNPHAQVRSAARCLERMHFSMRSSLLAACYPLLD